VAPALTHDATHRGEIRVVDIASGSEQVVNKVFTYNDAGSIVYFGSAGIYVTKGCPSGCLPDSGQLWLLNPDTGTLTKVTNMNLGAYERPIAWKFAHGTAWCILLTLTTGGEPVHAELVRLDLLSGKQITWATWDWSNRVFASQLAIDNRGLPLVIESAFKAFRDPSPDYRLVRFDAPNTKTVVVDFPRPFDSSGFVTESAGTWYWTGGEFFLYAPPAPPRSVAAISGYVYRAEGVLGD
jgi:hypothetical protein